MKKYLLIKIIALSIFSITAHAKIQGIATRAALLSQLQLSLGVNIQDLNLPTSLVAKLPVKNEIEEIKTSFLNSWTQITYLACSATSTEKNVNDFTKNPKSWIRIFAKKTWAVEPNDKEVDDIYQIVNGLNDESLSNKYILTCSLILSSPRVYIINF
jgi:hypothetical protein